MKTVYRITYPKCRGGAPAGAVIGRIIGEVPGSVVSGRACRAHCTAPRNTRMPKPGTSRSKIIWTVTTSLPVWLVAVISPKPTVLKRGDREVERVRPGELVTETSRAGPGHHKIGRSE